MPGVVPGRLYLVGAHSMVAEFMTDHASGIYSFLLCVPG